MKQIAILINWGIHFGPVNPAIPKDDSETVPDQLQQSFPLDCKKTPYESNN